MKVDISRLKKGTSEVPIECQQLIDCLRSCNKTELCAQLSRIETWTFGKCELYHWIDILDIFDGHLESACTSTCNQQPATDEQQPQQQNDENLSTTNEWYLACDMEYGPEEIRLLLLILKFTTLLIEHSFSRHLYNSVEHLTRLLSSSNMEIVLGVLNLLYMFSKRSNFISRLKSTKKQALLTRLNHIAESWGGKEYGFALASCCYPDDDKNQQKMPKSSTFFYEFHNQLGQLDSIELHDLEKCGKHPADLAKEICEKIGNEMDDDRKMHIFTRIRLCLTFHRYSARLQFVQARLQAISVLVYSNSLQENIHTVLYPGFLEELVELLEMKEKHLVDLRAAALRTLTSIIHLDRNPHFPKKPGSRLDMIIDVTGAATYHGFLPTLVRSCIQHLTAVATAANNTAGTTASTIIDIKMATQSMSGQFPLPLATALFSFLYHLASYESGGEALVACGMMESLLRVINWPGYEVEHITFVTRAVRVIDLITTIEMQSFQSHGGLNSFIGRLDMEVNCCRIEQPFEMGSISCDSGGGGGSMNQMSTSGAGDDIYMSPVDDMPSIVNIPLPPQEAAAAAAIPANSLSGGIQPTPQSNKPKSQPKTCLPQRAALLKSMLNFLKKAIQDPAFSDSIRHVMEGTLPNSLRHIISNAEYYGPSLFLLATDVVTVYVFQEPSLLSSLQDNGLTDVVLQALLKKDVPATREVLGSLPNVFSALCLNARGLAAFVKYQPFDRLFKVLLSPIYLTAMRRRRSSDPMGDTASNLGNAMDELMRHQPSLKTEATKAIIKLLEELVHLGTDPAFICWRSNNRNEPAGGGIGMLQANTTILGQGTAGNDAGSSDEDEEDEEEASTSSHHNQREDSGVSAVNQETPPNEVMNDDVVVGATGAVQTTVGGTDGVEVTNSGGGGANSERQPVPLLDYILNVMKFVDAILSNNSTDDHCREFVAQGGLKPLLSILALPNLPVDSPITASAQAVASVCKSILNLAHEPQVLQVGLEQLSVVVDQLQPLQRHIESPGGSVLLGELARCSDIDAAFSNASYTPLLHAMSAVHGYIVMLVHVCRTGQSDIRTLLLNKWGQDTRCGKNLLKNLVQLYTALVWESTLLLALCTDDIFPTESDFGKEDIAKLQQHQSASDITAAAAETPDVEMQSAPAPSTTEMSAEIRFRKKLIATSGQLRYIKALLGASSRLGRALAELFGNLVKLCVGSPIRQRRGQNFPPTPAFTSSESQDIARVLSYILVDGFSYDKLLPSPVPKLKLTFLICSVGFTGPMLFDEKRYAFHLMLHKFVEEGGLEAFFEMFRWALTSGHTMTLAKAIESQTFPDGTGEFLDAWLMLLEKMVNPKAILESPHIINTRGSGRKSAFDSVLYLVNIHRMAFDAVTQIWGMKPLHTYGVRMTESMMSIMKHILKGDKIIKEKYRKLLATSTDAGPAVATAAVNETINNTSSGGESNADLPLLIDSTSDSESSVVSLTSASGTASSSSVVVNQERMQQLMDMGFSRDHCMEALVHSISVETATDYLLNHPPPPPSPPLIGDLTQQKRTAAAAKVEDAPMGSSTSNKPKYAIKNEPPNTADEFRVFADGAIEKCVYLMEQLPDTVNKGTELIALIFRRSSVAWKEATFKRLINRMLNVLEDIRDSIKASKILDAPKKSNLIDRVFFGATASRFQVRLHIYCLFLDETFPEVRIPALEWVKIYKCAAEMIDLLHVTEAFVTKCAANKQWATTLNQAPKWLAQIITFLDLYEKVCLYTKRKDEMHRVTTRIWKWYDAAAGKWNAYSLSNNKIINAAYWSGEPSVRITCGRQRYAINFNCMSQVNEETGNHRPVILALEAIENRQPSAHRVKAQTTRSPNGTLTTRYAQPDSATVTPEEDHNRHIYCSDSEYTLPIGLAEFDTGRLVATCVRLMKHKANMERDTLHALMKLCVRLTKSFENAEIFAREGGVRLLLSMRQNCGYIGFPTLTILLIRHVLEEPKTLALAMERVIAARTLQRIPPGYRDLIFLLRQMSSAVSRDPEIFKEVAKATLRVDISVLRRNPVSEDNRLLIKAIPNPKLKTDGGSSTMENPVTVEVVRDLLNALIVPCVHLSPAHASSAQHNTATSRIPAAQAKETDDLLPTITLNPFNQLLTAPSSSSTATTSIFTASSSGFRRTAPTTISNTPITASEATASAKDSEKDEQCCGWHIPCITHEHDKPLLPRSTILKFLGDAVRSYQTFAPLITEHVYKAGDSPLITTDTTCLSFILDKLLPVTELTTDREVSLMSRALIAALASCSEQSAIQYNVVTEVKDAINRALAMPESADKHLQLQILTGLIPTMLENCPPENNSPLKAHLLPKRYDIFYIMVDKGMITDLAKLTQYLDLSSPYAIQTVNAALKPLEALLRMTNQPGTLPTTKTKKIQLMAGNGGVAGSSAAQTSSNGNGPGENSVDDVITGNATVGGIAGRRQQRLPSDDPEGQRCRRAIGARLIDDDLLADAENAIRDNQMEDGIENSNAQELGVNGDTGNANDEEQSPNLASVLMDLDHLLEPVTDSDSTESADSDSNDSDNEDREMEDDDENEEQEDRSEIDVDEETRQFIEALDQVDHLYGRQSPSIPELDRDSDDILMIRYPDRENGGAASGRIGRTEDNDDAGDSTDAGQTSSVASAGADQQSSTAAGQNAPGSPSGGSIMFMNFPNVFDDAAAAAGERNASEPISAVAGAERTLASQPIIQREQNSLMDEPITPPGSVINSTGRSVQPQFALVQPGSIVINPSPFRLAAMTRALRPPQLDSSDMGPAGSGVRVTSAGNSQELGVHRQRRYHFLNVNFRNTPVILQQLLGPGNSLAGGRRTATNSSSAGVANDVDGSGNGALSSVNGTASDQDDIVIPRIYPNGTTHPSSGGGTTISTNAFRDATRVVLMDNAFGIFSNADEGAIDLVDQAGYLFGRSLAATLSSTPTALQWWLEEAKALGLESQSDICITVANELISDLEIQRNLELSKLRGKKKKKEEVPNKASTSTEEGGEQSVLNEEAKEEERLAMETNDNNSSELSDSDNARNFIIDMDTIQEYAAAAIATGATGPQLRPSSGVNAQTQTLQPTSNSVQQPAASPPICEQRSPFFPTELENEDSDDNDEDDDDEYHGNDEEMIAEHDEGDDEEDDDEEDDDDDIEDDCDEDEEDDEDVDVDIDEVHSNFGDAFSAAAAAAARQSPCDDAINRNNTSHSEQPETTNDAVSASERSMSAAPAAEISEPSPEVVIHAGPIPDTEHEESEIEAESEQERESDVVHLSDLSDTVEFDFAAYQSNNPPTTLAAANQSQSPEDQPAPERPNRLTNRQRLHPILQRWFDECDFLISFTPESNRQTLVVDVTNENRTNSGGDAGDGVRWRRRVRTLADGEGPIEDLTESVETDPESAAASVSQTVVSLSAGLQSVIEEMNEVAAEQQQNRSNENHEVDVLSEAMLVGVGSDADDDSLLRPLTGGDDDMPRIQALVDLALDVVEEEDASQLQQEAASDNQQEQRRPSEADEAAASSSTAAGEAARQTLGDLEVPEGVDPSFLAALPQEMRQEVISEHLRMQRVRQRAQQNAIQIEHASVAEVNPEFLAALPPNIQEEVLAQQRIEQQRQAAATTDPNDPVDAAAFFENLQPSLRQAILTDMEDSQISVLPPDLAAEAQNLRRDWENRNRQILQERLLLSSTTTNLSSVLRYRGRVPAPRFQGNNVIRAPWTNWRISGGTTAANAEDNSPSLMSLMERHGKPLLDYEALTSLLVLLFVDEPKFNILRLHRVIRNICCHVPTRQWIIRTLLSIVERSGDACSAAALPFSGRTTTRPQWLNIRLDAALGSKANVFVIQHQADGSTTVVSIHPQASQIVCKHTLDLLIALAKSFPRSFLPLRKNSNEAESVEKPVTDAATDKATSQVAGPSRLTTVCNDDSTDDIGRKELIDFWDIIIKLDAAVPQIRAAKGPTTTESASNSKSMTAEQVTPMSVDQSSSENHMVQKSSQEVPHTFEDSPFGQLISMLSFGIVKKSCQLTDKLLRLLSLISFGLPDSANNSTGSDSKTVTVEAVATTLLTGTETVEPVAESTENEAAPARASTPISIPTTTKNITDLQWKSLLPDSEDQLLLAIEVLTSKSCSEEGLEDATSLLLNLSQCSTHTRSIILNLLIKAVKDLARMVQQQIVELMTELKQLNGGSVASISTLKKITTTPTSGYATPSDLSPEDNQPSQSTASTSSAASGSIKSKGILQDRFTKETVIISAAATGKVKQTAELQLSSMVPLISKTSSQAFFLRILKVIIQIRESMRAAANKPVTEQTEPGPSTSSAGELSERSLSETLDLDVFWETLSSCLLELEETADSHAVLVLQSAVEAFFLVHASVKQPASKEKAQKQKQRSEVTGGQRQPAAEEESGDETEAGSDRLNATISIEDHDMGDDDAEDNITAAAALNTASITLSTQLASTSSGSSQGSQSNQNASENSDQIKFLQFAEKHRTVLNQILRQTTVHLSDGPFAVLVDHTRILDFDVKRRYFRTELERLDEGIRREELAVHVHRVTVFEDSFRELYRRNPEEWKNRFYIVFEDEEGQDAGGLLREWYVIISREIFNPMYALFTVSPGDRVTYMINPSSHANPNHLCYYKFVGRVIAKAIYDNKLLECYFTRSFYKHILGIQVKYTDMESEDYDFYKGLVFLLENHISALGYELTFSLEVQEFGVTEIRDLIPNGRNIPVTEDKKLEYIHLVCQLKMSGSIRQQLNAFLEGFYDIIPKRLISIFNEQELELLISGLPNVDIEDLKANTEYHKYQSSSIQIQWFWRALRSFDQADRAKFLQFVTGTSKVPLQGFAALEGMNGTQKFQIHRDDRSTDRLPSAHTCFNQLDLPVYKTYDKLRANLLKAIHECSEGFGFA